MKVLVYGAGVIGCELAHILVKNRNDVTLLARGKWKENIDKNGIIIKHVIQMNTTQDNIKTIEKLEENDIYDIIFVVMQYGQLNNVLPILGKNKTKSIVFIGNNMNAEYYEKKVIEFSEIEKEIAFGFQSTGGRRENNKVLSVHFNFIITIGRLNNTLSDNFKNILNNIFKEKQYEIERNMDAWLKCHMAFILPICYVCYKTNGRLKAASKDDINNIIDATIEAHEMLKTLGYEIRPDGEEEYFLNKNRKKCYFMLRIMAKTPLGRLAASDHAMHAVDEMTLFDEEFIKLRKSYSGTMSVWDKLREEGMD